jgi:hypothetical protein
VKNRLNILVAQNLNGYEWEVIAEGSGRNVVKAGRSDTLEESFTDAVLYSEGLLDGLKDGKEQNEVKK